MRRPSIWQAVLLTAAGLAFPLPGLGQDAGDYPAWSHRQSLSVPAPGLSRLDLAPGLLDVSRAGPGRRPLGDLRLADPQGRERPYVLVWPEVGSAAARAAVRFTAVLRDEETVLDIEAGEGVVTDLVRLETTAADFIKAADLQGERADGTWETLASGRVLCRQDGTELLEIAFPAGAWRRWRLTIDDRRSPPVAFTGAVLRETSRWAPEEPQPVRITSRREEVGATVLRVDLGAANLFLGIVRLETDAPLFKREVRVLDPSGPGAPALLSGPHTVFRLELGERRDGRLELPVHRLIPVREIELRVDNGDSPPLPIGGLVATRHAAPLVFAADAAGTWALYAGNPLAPEPDYDVASLQADWAKAELQAARGGEVEANPGYRRDAVLPQAGEAGAAVDLAGWSWGRTVRFAGPGVLRIALDASVLSRAAPDLRDVRLVQEGKQIPYLMEREPGVRMAEADWKESADPRQASVSRWRIALPVSGLPVRELRAVSPTPLFERRVEVWEEGPNEPGRRGRRVLGEATWRQTSADGGEWVLPLTARPAGGTVYLETDNGDNAPLRLSQLRLGYAGWRLLCRVGGTGPLQLVYGNRRADAPRYDLELLRQDLLSAPALEAALGPEEPLRAGRGISRWTGAGSVWLWVALVLVVGGLLWLVARLLPERPGNGTEPS